MGPLCNLVVELREPFPIAGQPGIQIALPGPADGRTLAWIDDAFGGAWSGEAFAGTTVVARLADSPIGFATYAPAGMRYAWLARLGSEPGVGVFGPLGVAEGERERGLGALLVRLALNGLRERGYDRALIPAVGDGALIRFYAQAVGARVAERFERDVLLRTSRRTLVLASGNGSNFQAVLNASRAGTLPIEIVGLVCNDAKAHAIERARAGGLDAIAVVAWDRAHEDRAAYDDRLLEVVQAHEPDLVLLLGWMHLLSDPFVSAFAEIVNLHPAFLPLDESRDDVTMPDGTIVPAFRGARAVRDALAAKSAWVGATLHRVTPQTDRGPVLARKPLRVKPGEEESGLMERVHEIERGVVRAGLMRWLYER